MDNKIYLRLEIIGKIKVYDPVLYVLIRPNKKGVNEYINTPKITSGLHI